MIWSELFRFLFLSPTILHSSSSLSSRCSMGCRMNWLAHSLYWWVQVALRSLYVASFSAIIYRGYDLILMLSRIGLRVLCIMSFLGIPLLCFACRDYYAQAWRWLLLAPLATSTDAALFASRSMCMSFMFFCSVLSLASAFTDAFRESLSPSDSCPHSWARLSVTSMFFSLALCLEHWAVVCYPSRGTRSSTPLIRGYWWSMYNFFHAVYRASQIGGFQRARDSHVHAYLHERAEAPERSEAPGLSPLWWLA